MGSGLSVPSSPAHRQKIDPFHAVFIGDATQRAEAGFASDATFRHCFVEFIKNGRWVDKLIHYEELCREDARGLPWQRFGYERPPETRRVEVSAKASFKSSSSNRTLNTLISDTSSRQNSVKDIGKPEPLMGDVIEHWSLGTSAEDVRSILLVMLCPLFFNSREYKYWCQPGITASYSSSDDSIPWIHQQSVDEQREISTKLREMMISAAAAFDSSDLDEYLANPTPCLIADFKSALNNLPLSFNVLDVADSSAGSNGTELLYGSAGKPAPSPTWRSFSARNLRDGAYMEQPSTRSVGSIIRANSFSPTSLKMQVCSSLKVQGVASWGADYTVEQRLQVETALAEHARLKLALPASQPDRCVLRALKPVQDATGTVRCMLSVESLNHVVVSRAADSAANLRIFQQVDDLLLLLPALIRMD
jgi:hypothetical protein